MLPKNWRGNELTNNIAQQNASFLTRHVTDVQYLQSYLGLENHVVNYHIQHLPGQNIPFQPRTLTQERKGFFFNH